LAVSFDAQSFKDLTGVGGTFTHVPVGTPCGIAVMVAANTITDVIASVTFGGNALTRAGFMSGGVASEPGSAYLYFLGTAVATSGTVNVVGTGGTYTAWAVTMTANQAWTEVAGTATQTSTSLANPSGTIHASSGDDGLVVGVLFSGANAPATNVANPGYTALTGSAAGGVDFGSQSGCALQGRGSGATVSYGWANATADDVAAVGALIREKAPVQPFPMVNAAWKFA
jgi:fibronectin-binding autotransporter adhesin